MLLKAKFPVVREDRDERAAPGVAIWSIALIIPTKFEAADSARFVIQELLHFSAGDGIDRVSL
jgi:hypothetical protein